MQNLQTTTLNLKNRSGIASTVTVLIVVIIIIAIIAGVGWEQALTAPKTATTSSTTGVVSLALIQQAQAECASKSTCLTIYSTIDTSDWTADFLPRFVAAFPWVTGKVNYQGLSAAQVTSEGISQYQAGKVQADLFSATLGIVTPIIAAGAVYNYTAIGTLASLMNYTTGQYDPNYAWVADGQSLIGLQYNTNAISPAQAATLNWSSLANTQYKGKISFQTATSLSATTGIFYYLSTQMSNASWTALMKSIAANSPTITASASDATNNIATGQSVLGIGLYNDFLSANKSGSPIGIVFPSPSVYNPQICAIAKNAPDPAMAELADEWFMSASGQTAWASSGRTPIQSSIALEYHLYPPGVVFNNAFTNPAILSNTASWSALFKSIYGA